MTMLLDNKKYGEFLKVCSSLNKKLNVIPVLFGSLGLEVLTQYDFNADDIDLLVPEDYHNKSWTRLKTLIESLSYEFVDLHEQEFKKKGVKLAFGVEESLQEFADVNFETLVIIEDENARFKLLNAVEYLRVYKASYKDSYRRDKNNGKDMDKITYLEKHLKSTF